MEVEVEVSLVGDGGYLRALVNVPIKGEGGKIKYTNLVLGLVREVEKEDEEEEGGGSKEELKDLPSCVKIKGSRKCLLIGLEVECEGNRRGRRKGRAIYRQENVVSCMSKSLVGVGDP
jgi:hypothetical protein